MQRSGALLQRHEQRLRATVEAAAAFFRGRPAQRLVVCAPTSALNKVTRFPTSLPAQVDAVDPYDFSPGNFYDILGMTRGHKADRDNRIRTFAMTLENRTEVLPGVAIVSALRKDFIDLTNRRAVTAASPASASRSYSPLIGRLGVNWQVSPEASLYAQYATAADPPSGLPATAHRLPTAEQRPAHNRHAAEVGGKFDWDGAVPPPVASTRSRQAHLDDRPQQPGRQRACGRNGARR